MSIDLYHRMQMQYLHTEQEVHNAKSYDTSDSNKSLDLLSKLQLTASKNILGINQLCIS